MEQIPYEYLLGWCDLHHIHLGRDREQAIATAYDRHNRPITRVIAKRPGGELQGAMPPQDKDMEIAILACDQIAVELCLLKPSIAHRLNHDSATQPNS